MSDTNITLAELKAAAQAESAARTRLTYLFDEGYFTELNAYAMEGSDLSGVITAFGYVEGNPVYAFSQDINVKNGALTTAHSKKIVKVFDLAAKTGVPVIGIYDSFGADVSNGCEAL
ncbi:MAG: carboxyl transferase domain-containing protein, partial [Hominimerdicola sp.]